MTKVPNFGKVRSELKCLKLRNSIILIKKMERSETLTLGTLAHFRHFRHFQL